MAMFVDLLPVWFEDFLSGAVIKLEVEITVIKDQSDCWVAGLC